MTVASSSARGARSVEAVIVDDAGRIVAQRTLTDRSGRACLPLAHAVGAWASLVLDAEMNRAKDDDGTDGGEAGNVHEASSHAAVNSVGRANVGFANALPAPGAARDLSPDDRPAEGSIDRASGDAEKVPSRSVELGTMVYLRNGMTRTGGVAGLAPFVTVEVSSGWVLRPGLFFGRSTSAGGPPLSHMGGRVDFCRRFPGNYVDRRGIEADLCAGLEGGLVTSADVDLVQGERTSGRLGIGPSANLRGELGAGLALEVRGLVGANMLQAQSLAPLVFVSGELGISMRLP